MASRAETKAKYADILCMERPMDEKTLRKHPRMKISDRAKIFAPFAALRGHSERLSTEDRKLLRHKRIEMSEGEADKLSDKLVQVTKGMQVGVLYFKPDSPESEMGNYICLEGKVTEYDPVFRVLKIENTRIKFDDLADVYGADIVNIDDALAQYEHYSLPDQEE